MSSYITEETLRLQLAARMFVSKSNLVQKRQKSDELMISNVVCTCKTKSIRPRPVWDRSCQDRGLRPQDWLKVVLQSCDENRSCRAIIKCCVYVYVVLSHVSAWNQLCHSITATTANQSVCLSYVWLVSKFHCIQLPLTDCLGTPSLL